MKKALYHLLDAGFIDTDEFRERVLENNICREDSIGVLIQAIKDDCAGKRNTATKRWLNKGTMVNLLSEFMPPAEWITPENVKSLPGFQRHLQLQGWTLEKEGDELVSITAPAEDTQVEELKKSLLESQSQNEQLIDKINELTEANQKALASQNQFITLNIPVMEQGRVVDIKVAELEYLEYRYDEIEKYVSIAPENTRWSETLNERNLADLISDFKAGVEQQWPGIGYGVRESLKLLDGQRRQKAMILASNESLVFKAYRIVNAPEISLTKDDLEFIVRVSKQAKENSKVELAFEWLELCNTNGWDYKELAMQKDVSPATVTRIMKATLIPQHWYAYLPDIYSLNNEDISRLATAVQGLNEEQMAKVEDSIKEAASKLDEDESLTTDSFVAAVVGAGRKKAKELAPSRTQPIESESLGNWSDKQTTAKRTFKPKARQVIYEFKRLPKHVQKELDIEIRRVIDSHKPEKA